MNYTAPAFPLRRWREASIESNGLHRTKTESLLPITPAKDGDSLKLKRRRIGQSYPQFYPQVRSLPSNGMPRLQV